MPPPQPTDEVRRFFFDSFFFAFLSHTHATSWLTDTHTIPLRGRVYVCVCDDQHDLTLPSFQATQHTPLPL